MAHLGTTLARFSAFAVGTFVASTLVAPAGALDTAVTPAAPDRPVDTSMRTNVAVSIGNNFSPRALTIVAGDTVMWTNNDDRPHTATGTGPGSSFDSGLMAVNDTWSHVFASPGTFDYVCLLHDGMTATVTVTEAPAAAPLRPGIGAAAPGAAGGTLTATARWRAPAGGTPVAGYVATALRMSAAGTVLKRTRSPVLPAGARSRQFRLPAGSYRFVVVATNAAGRSPESARSNLVAAR